MGMKILDKQKKELYLLDFNTIEPDSLKILLESHGYDIYNIKDVNGLVNKVLQEKTPSQAEDPQNTGTCLIYIEENAKKDSLKTFFSHFHPTIRWITEILDQFHIGFSLFNNQRHILFNASFMDFIYHDYNNYKNLKVGDSLILEDRKTFRKKISQLIKGEEDYMKLEIHSITNKEKNLTPLLFRGFNLTIENTTFIAGFFIRSDQQKNQYLEIIIHELNQLIKHTAVIHDLNSYKKQKEVGQSMGKPKVQLTNREEEVLEHIYHGNTNQQISEKLNISIRTVETHRANLLSKTGSSNTADLIRYAVEFGLFSG